MQKHNWTPQDLVTELKKSIIGQEKYLEDLSFSVWLHSLRIRADRATGKRFRQPKMNLLVLGPSGSGKSSAVQKLAELLQIPVLVEDASYFTGSGWKGRDVSSIVKDILSMGSEDSYYTIVVLDEIDKMFLNSEGTSGFAAQNNLLRMMEGGIITHDEGSKTYSMDTSGLLFICLGAFDGITELIRKRMAGSRQIGFGAMSDNELLEEEFLEHVTYVDLKAYGLNEQFLGRIGLITATRKLNAHDMEQILTESENSAIRQFNTLFSESVGIEVAVTPAAVHEISGCTMGVETGARGLTAVVATALRPALLAASEDRSVDKITADYAEGHIDIQFHHKVVKFETSLQDSMPMYTEQELREYSRLPIAFFHYTYEEIVYYAQTTLEEDMKENAGSRPYLYSEVKAAAYLLAAVMMWLVRSGEELSMGAVYRGLEQIAVPVRKLHEKRENPNWEVFFPKESLTLLGKARDFQSDLLLAHQLICEVWDRKCKERLQKQRAEKMY